MSYRDYWNRNIGEWGKLYFDISHGHEALHAPRWFAALYRATAGRLERRLMAQRYAITSAFISQHVGPGTVFADIGCGTGLFVRQALARGATVLAVDFSETALAMTREAVGEAGVAYICADIQQLKLPPSDVTLAMGLAPYVTDLNAFLSNALSNTDLFMCLYIDPSHWANRLRRAIPFLNVRRLQCHAKDDVDATYKRLGFVCVRRRKFATGFIDVAASLRAYPRGLPPHAGVAV